MKLMETAIYAVQIASFFFLAGPILIRSERQRTLARNPAWVAGHPEFLSRHGKADIHASVACGLILLPLLGTAFALDSRPFLFLVHAVAFGIAAVWLVAWNGRREARLREEIPEEPVRRASLRPRTMRDLLPAWALPVLGLGVAASLGLDAWGWLSGSMAPARAMGNATFLGLFAAGMGLAIRYIVGRPSLRLSEGTDSAARSLELSLALGTCCFVVLVSLYHTLGSLGPNPLFAFPPTLIHARIEGLPWSWSVFFARPEYRAVEIAASLVIAGVGPWLAVSPFNRRLLSVDMRRVRSAAEV